MTVVRQLEAHNTMLLAGTIGAEKFRQGVTPLTTRLAEIDAELARPPIEDTAIIAGEQLARLPAIWAALVAHQDFAAMGEVAHALLPARGIAWDTSLRAIARITPHPEYVPAMQLALTDWACDGTSFTPSTLHSLPYRVSHPSPSASVRDGRGRASSLSAEQIAQIRRLCAGGTSTREVGKRFGVSATTISRIVRKEQDHAADTRDE